MGPATRRSSSVEHVSQFAAAAERLADAVATADMRAAVPTCPGWRVIDLVKHLGNVHARTATILETGQRAPEQNDRPRSSRPRAVSGWYLGKAGDLYEVLRHTDLTEPCWNFAFGSGVKAFWSRRQLHETTIHQVDLDLASGRGAVDGSGIVGPLPIEPAVAADGIDEVLTVFAHRMHSRGHAARLERPLAITATDTGDHWLVAPQPRRTSSPQLPAQATGSVAESVHPLPPSVERRRVSAEAVQDRVTGTADVLLRLLWKRLPVDDREVHVDGDAARVRAYLTSPLVP
jgi:uncharacterized protein (TIGR03083 family)